MTALSTEESTAMQIQTSENLVSFHCARNSLCVMVHNSKHGKREEKHQRQTSGLTDLLKKFIIKQFQPV